ncbi:hypothetical protein BD560DRAFT_325504, partial [Blakeslea trispora]
ISRFHRQPSSLTNSAVLSTFLSTVTSSTPPRHTHRPTIEASPTLSCLLKIPSDLSSSLSLLQQKLAFLLGMVAFHHASDFARTSLLLPSFPNNCLSFVVIALKERRNGIRIIKPFLVHPYSNASLCPVACFRAVVDHPSELISLRSLGFSLALRQGFSVDDIVTLDNWRSSNTFHNH